MSSPLGPMWVASPPEVHSALLSSGPGPASLLAAAGAWTALSSEYASAAAELEGLLGAVAAGAWQGPSAEQYVAAHQPYVTWLLRASADAAAMAARLDTAAAAYSTALAAMPTLAELATNHLVHGVLVATNFFGVNMVPIALNEADYLRMWLQAAATMALYQAAAGAALASAPRTGPAPVVVHPGGDLTTNAATAAATDPWQWLLQVLQQFYNAYTSFYSAMFQEIAAFLQDPIGNTIKIFVAFLTNPEAAIVTYGPLLFALAYQVFFNIVGWPTWTMILSSPFLLPIGLSLGLSAIALLPATAPVLVPAAAAPLALAATTAHAVWPVAGMVPATAGVAGAPAGAGAAGASAVTPAPMTATGTTIAPYVVAVGGDWGPSLGPTVGGRSGAKAPAATIPAAGAAAVSSASARVKRRRRAQLHDHSDEFLDMDAGSGASPEPFQAQASERGAGRFGFAGTVPSDTLLQAAGLTALAADFGGSPHLPMVPGTWERGREEGGAGSQRDDLPSREF
ncbi:PPE family protein [Mycobacterium gordonae]|uniref:PPE family protein n=1 Tax=Mycobacterium gordonae TaxID=1778 RepID=A0A1A6BAQ8_MYCGO|nr:PPE family protein [Mycobacterium gordonae]MCV7006676.1 PPE family protein [Mycobacterium gordonae]OBR99370.1 hypothetical protein A9W98_30460 [Mycobacterium gordonae]ODR19524.1 hypothetical protein BHQ23_19355 [Mycobacterium gordonae]ORV82086.1 hypothetical protein AWC08_28985 [Mycobacterium gordonae]